MKLPKPFFFTKRHFRVPKEAAPPRSIVPASRCWRRCCGAARSASGTGAFESYLGAAPRVVETSIDDRPDLLLSPMRKLAHRRASSRFEVQACIGWASVLLELVEVGMRRSPGGLCGRGCHDHVMIYRGETSVSRMRAVVLRELVMYLRSVATRPREHRARLVIGTVGSSNLQLLKTTSR